MDGCVNVDACMDGWVHGHGCMHTDACMHERVHVWVDAWREGETERGVDEK